MKRAILGLFLVCLIQLFFNFSHAEAIIKTKAVKQISEKSPTFRLNETYGKLPLYFVRNDGQLDKKVKFYEKGRGHAVYFTKEGVFLSLMVTGKPRKSRWQHALIKLIPLNANKELMIVAEGHKKTKVNFFIGNDPKKWKTNIPTYGAIIYKDVYKNTDIRFYGNNRELEYDVIMRPGADLNDIKFSYEGIEALSITKDGDLNIILKEGMLIQKRPRIYQKIDGKEVQVTGKFKIQSKKSNIIGKESTTNSQRFVYGFEVASYHTRYPLIIDPTLSYSTYLGGSSDDDGYGIAVDSNGNAYIAGYTKSTDFPTASAIYGNNSGSWDAFIAKINSNGSALVYSTYLGGSNNETVDMGIAVDSDGNAYVTGYTNSTDFPTASAIYGELSGITDAFVTKINVDGSALVYSTYLGGSRNEDGKGIAVDGNSNAYVTGRTNSTDFPTASAIYGNFAGGVTDAFVTKINADGSALVYSTYLGGSNDDGTEMGIAVDSDGNAYVTGNTNSNDFPIVSAIYEELAGGQDSFVTKINSDGSTLVYSTYLGGSGTDGGKGIAVDNDGNAYVAGNTSSNDFPIASAIYEEPAGGSDAFVTKINSNGSAFVYSTYLGGSGTDGGKGIAVDNDGIAYVTGNTSSNDFPIASAIYGELAGDSDAFVTKIKTDGSALVYSTYLGGSVTDGGDDIAVDSNGNAYITGYTNSTDFPTAFAINASHSGGGSDAFVAKFVGITLTSTDATISEVTALSTPEGAQSGFSVNEVVSFKCTGVTNTADLSITFTSLPTDPVFYKVVNTSWLNIYPTNDSTGITNVTLSGNTLSYTIADNSDCDENPTTGTIEDPLVAGSQAEEPPSGDSGGGGGGG